MKALLARVLKGAGSAMAPILEQLVLMLLPILVKWLRGKMRDAAEDYQRKKEREKQEKTDEKNAKKYRDAEGRDERRKRADDLLNGRDSDSTH